MRFIFKFIINVNFKLINYNKRCSMHHRVCKFLSQNHRYNDNESNFNAKKPSGDFIL